MAEMEKEERRAHGRLLVRCAVRVRLPGGGELEGRVENLGGLGALVFTTDLEAPLQVGDRLALTIEVPDKGTVDATGEVLRLDQEFAEGEIVRTFAVRFDDPVPH